MFPFFTAQGVTPTLFSRDTIAAAAAAALNPPSSSTVAPPKRGRHSEATSRAPSVQGTERGPQTPRAVNTGDGQQLGSTPSPATTQRETSDNRCPPATPATGNSRGSGPALPHPCSGLILSGNNVQASWAG
ncbi:unnamed protein product, partial [Laminaria digitata]